MAEERANENKIREKRECRGDKNKVIKASAKLNRPIEENEKSQCWEISKQREEDRGEKLEDILHREDSKHFQEQQDAERMKKMTFRIEEEKKKITNERRKFWEFEKWKKAGKMWSDDEA